jgi:adenosylhomocysteine nucleosidase
MICYAFPLAHEASQVLKQCTQKDSFSIGNLHCVTANYHNRPVLIALIGMGHNQAAENTKAIFHYFRPKAVVLSGYGGALVPQLKVGQIVISNNFSSEELLPFLRLLSGFDFGGFCTTDELVGTPEKREWYARSTQHQVADMETAAVADIVLERQIPFLALRVISDEYGHVLPIGALNAGFDVKKGRATPFRLLTYLLTHPGEVMPLKKFVSCLSLARRKLTNFLREINNELPAHW